MTEQRYSAVVIGASAGALSALSEILPKLPEGLKIPILIVVHLPPDKESILAELFSSKCKLPAKEAEDKEIIEAGMIYFAPPDYHMLVENDKSISLSVDDPVLFSRPSIDVLFESAADAYGEEVVGIILSGANNDGANGLKMVAEMGGITLIQQPDSASSKDMPKAAIKACPQAKVLSLNEIAKFISRL